MGYFNKMERPLLRYHGGKFRLAEWIISHFPDHRVYVESFGGAGSILLSKERVYSEVYNDLDTEIVNLFRMCRERGEELIEVLELTPFSRQEFELSYQHTDDNLERARRTLIRSFMGFGSAAVSTTRWAEKSKGFRTKGRYNGEYGKLSPSAKKTSTTPAEDWRNYADALPVIIERMRGVVIECKDAIQVMKQHDSKNTLHYVDPPYVPETRYLKDKTQCYNFEMTSEQHVELCSELLLLDGKIILSGYDNEIYNDMLPTWRKSKKKARADGSGERTEILWLSPNIHEKPNLFS